MDGLWHQTALWRVSNYKALPIKLRFIKQPRWSRSFVSLYPMLRVDRKKVSKIRSLRWNEGARYDSTLLQLIKRDWWEKLARKIIPLPWCQGLWFFGNSRYVVPQLGILNKVLWINVTTKFTKYWLSPLSQDSSEIEWAARHRRGIDLWVRFHLDVSGSLNTGSRSCGRSVLNHPNHPFMHCITGWFPLLLPLPMSKLAWLWTTF